MAIDQNEHAIRVALTQARLPASDNDITELAQLYPNLREMAERIKALAEADDYPADLVFQPNADTSVIVYPETTQQEHHHYETTDGCI